MLKTLKVGFYVSEIDTRGWPYRGRDLTLPPNHTFAAWSIGTSEFESYHIHCKIYIPISKMVANE